MKLNFIVNYRLDSPADSNVRIVKLLIPDSISGHIDKDEYLLYYCGKITGLCRECHFYKRVQVMAPFLERPIRIKYMLSLPNNECILLDASTERSELRRKAKELADYFDIARKQNKSHFIIKHSILLMPYIETNIAELEDEYGIRIVTLNEAIKFVNGIVANAKSDQ